MPVLKKPRSLRIIAGKWRGRKVTFANNVTLRPTPDRVRETLFNWLAPYIVQANCLDLFAGSGILGFEALSRGAKKVTAVEQDHSTVVTIKNNMEILGAVDLEPITADAVRWVEHCQEKFDLIFLDPPYKNDTIIRIINNIQNLPIFAAEALIYLEWDQPIIAEQLPANWRIIKSSHAGQIYCYLAQCIPPRDVL